MRRHKHRYIESRIADILRGLCIASFYDTGLRYLSSAQKTLLLKVFGNNLDGTFDVDLVGLDVNLRARRRLVGRRNTREFYDRSGEAALNTLPNRETPHKNPPLISPLLAFL